MPHAASLLPFFRILSWILFWYSCFKFSALNFLMYLFSYLFIFFLPALFSQYCNASLDITQASLSCSTSAESNLLRRATARRIRLSFFSFTLKCSFFFSNIQNTQGGQIADMCVRRGRFGEGGLQRGDGGEGGGGEAKRDSCILSCKKNPPHCLFKDRWTL